MTPERTSATGFERWLAGAVLAEGKGPAWRRLLVQHVRRPREQPPFVVPAVAEPQLVWVTRGRAHVEERAGTGAWQGAEVGPGDFFLSDSPTPYELRWSVLGREPFELLMVYLDLALLRRVALAVHGAGEHALRDVSAARDPVVSALLAVVQRELGAPRASALVVEGVAQALAVHLLRTYATAPHPRIALGAQKLRRAVTWLEEHLARDLDLGALARHVGLSPSHLSRAFRRSTGLAPSHYLLRLRIERARHLLRETDRTVLAIALEVGYASHSHFTKAFRAEVGVTPTAYRR